MAFKINAAVSVVGPNNLNTVVNDIKKQLGGLETTINIKTTGQGGLQQTVDTIRKQLEGINGNINIRVPGLVEVRKQADDARTAVQVLAEQTGIAARRFIAYTTVVGTFLSFAAAIKTSAVNAVEFQREMVRLTQISSDSASSIKNVGDNIVKMATEFGTSANDLAKAAVELRRAGLQANDLTTALNVLAKASLSVGFETMADSTKNLIALLGQFHGSASELESQFGSIVALTNNFAVSQRDLGDVIRSTGGTFKAAGGNLNELLALFTAIKGQTQQSSESIAFALKNIFGRIQKPEILESLREVGIDLRRTREEAEALGGANLAGQFVGPFEAVKRLGDALKNLSPADERFTRIADQLGGFRQIQVVIPLLEEATLQQRALSVAQAGSIGITDQATKAQEAFTVQLSSLKAELFGLGRNLVNSEGFKQVFDVFVTGTRYAIQLADALRPLIPLLTAIASVKVAQAIGTFAPNAIAAFTGQRRFAEGGVVPGQGNTDSVPAMLQPGEYVVRKSSAQAIGYSNLSKLNGGGGLNYGEYYDMNPSGYAIGGETTLKDELFGSLNRRGVGFFNRNFYHDVNILPPSQYVQAASQVGVSKSSSGYYYPRTGKIGIQGERSYDDLLTTLTHESLHKYDFETAGSQYYTPGSYRFASSIKGTPEFEFAREARKQSIVNDIKPAIRKLGGSQALSPQEKQYLRYRLSLPETFAFAGSDILSPNDSAPFSESGVPISARRLFAENILPNLKNMGGSIYDAGYMYGGYVPNAYGGGGNADSYSANGLTGYYGSGASSSYGYASGGSTDTMPAMLTPGEYVINKRAAQTIGRGTLDVANQTGKLPGYAEGGTVSGNRLTPIETFNLAPLNNQVATAADILSDKLRLLSRSIDETISIQRNKNSSEQQVIQLNTNRLDLLRNERQFNARVISQGIPEQQDTFVGPPAPGRFTRLGAGLRGAGNALSGVGSAIGRRLTDPLTLFSLLGAGSLISDRLTADTNVNNPSFVNNQGIAGSLSGAGIGAGLGVAFGPLGIAIGGLAGAILGYTSGINDAKEKIVQVKLDKTLDEFNAKLADFASGRSTTFNVGQQISGITGGIFEQTQNRLQPGFFQQLLEANNPALLFGGSRNAGPTSGLVLQESQNAVRTQLGPQLPTLLQGLSQEAEKLVRSFGATGKTTDELVASLYGSQKEVVEVIATIRRQSVKQVLDDFTKGITEAKRRVDVENRASSARANANQAVFTFDNLVKAVGTAADSLTELDRRLQTLDTLFHGTINPVLPNDVSKSIQQIGSPNNEAFRSGLNFTLSPLGNSPTIDRTRNLAEGLDQATRILPRVLSGSLSGTNLLTNETATTDIATRVRTGLNGLPEDIIRSITSKIEKMDTGKLLEELKDAPDKLVKTLLSDQAPLHEALTALSKDVVEQANKFSVGITQAQRNIITIGNEIDKVPQLRLTAERFQAARTAEATGRFNNPIDFLSFGQLTAPFQARQERLTGLNGAEARNPEVVARRLNEANQAVLAGQARVTGAKTTDEFIEASKSLADLQGNANRLQTALKTLAESTDRGAAAQEKLNRIETERVGRQNLGERLLTSDQSDIFRLNLGSQAAKFAARGGDIGALAPDIRRAFFEFTNATKDIRLRGLGGQTGEELRRSAFENSAVGKALGLTPEEKGQRAGLLKVQEEENATRIKAQEAYIGILSDTNNKFIGSLDESFTKFGQESRNNIKLLEDALRTDTQLRLNAERGTLGLSVGKADILGTVGIKGNAEANLVRSNLSDIEKLRGTQKDIEDLKAKAAGGVNLGFGVGNLGFLGQKFSPETAQSLFTSIQRGNPTFNNDEINRIIENIEAKKINGVVPTNEVLAQSGRDVFNQLANQRSQEFAAGRNALQGRLGGGLSADILLNTKVDLSKTLAEVGVDIDGLRKKFAELGDTLKSIEGKAYGGSIHGSDTVPAMLTPGEFVVNAQSAANNFSLLSTINSHGRGGAISYYAEGGDVDNPFPYTGKYFRPTVYQRRTPTPTGAQLASIERSLTASRLVNSVPVQDANGVNVIAAPAGGAGGNAARFDLQRSEQIFNTFSTNLNKAVDGLKQLPTKIELNANHRVEVIFNGADILAKLTPEMESIAKQAIKQAFVSLKGQLESHNIIVNYNDKE